MLVQARISIDKNSRQHIVKGSPLVVVMGNLMTSVKVWRIMDKVSCLEPGQLGTCIFQSLDHSIPDACRFKMISYETNEIVGNGLVQMIL